VSGWGNASLGEDASSLSGTRQASPLSQVLHGFRLQGRVVYALLLRELTTRFGRDQIGFLWVFFEPMMLALAIGAMKHLLDRGGHGGVPPFIFGVIGYAPYFAFRGMVNQASGALTSNMTLLYHRQIKLFDIMLARGLLQSAVATLVLVVVIAGTAWLVEMTPHSIPHLVGGLVLILLYSHGLAMLVAAGTAAFELSDRLVHPLTYLALPFSGALTPMHVLPPSWREVLLWNPQPHYHEMMRDGMFGDLLPAYYDVPYAVGWVIVLNLLGMFALRAARPKLEY
jgi:capsular polysaccharide transport system permease protein